jgi:hypothetical protein
LEEVGSRDLVAVDTGTGLVRLVAGKQCPLRQGGEDVFVYLGASNFLRP